MADLNNVSFTGRLTRDAIYKDISSGLAEFTMAINGYKPEETMYLKVNLWGKAAKPLLQYLLKGKQIGVTGTLKYTEWTNRDGVEHKDFIISTFGVTLLGDRPKEELDDDIQF